MATTTPAQCYIGDGVYASFDGYQIILETHDGYRTTNKIALDNEVLVKLEKYREYVSRFYQERKDE